MTVFYLVTGLVLLIVGAESLVRGASKLASFVGIPPLIVGLTVVAFGTSSPELAVSIMSAYAGQADVALGNVVGSNIFNVLFILGLSALIVPLVIAQQLIWLDVPLMICISVLTLILGYDGLISRMDGCLFFAGIVLYTFFLIRQSRKESAAIHAEYAQEFGDGYKPALSEWLLNSGMVLVGLVLLVLGSRWLVNSAVSIAQAFGVSELIIGLTIIAAGTSLPEVATSLIAAYRGERDIAVGNVVGSNIFNLLAVLGISSIVAPNGLAVPEAALNFDIPVMIAVAFACLPIFLTGHTIARWEGGLFLGYYIAYSFYLILASSEHDSLPAFNVVMLEFVIPLTLVTLLISVIRAMSKQKKA